MIDELTRFLTQKVGDRAFEATALHAKSVPLLEMLRKAYIERAEEIRRNSSILFLEVAAFKEMLGSMGR